MIHRQRPSDPSIGGVGFGELVEKEYMEACGVAARKSTAIYGARYQ